MNSSLPKIKTIRKQISREREYKNVFFGLVALVILSVVVFQLWPSSSILQNEPTRVHTHKQPIQNQGINIEEFKNVEILTLKAGDGKTFPLAGQTVLVNCMF